jgi:hypothetical protein
MQKEKIRETVRVSLTGSHGLSQLQTSAPVEAGASTSQTGLASFEPEPMS